MFSFVAIASSFYETLSKYSLRSEAIKTLAIPDRRSLLLAPIIKWPLKLVLFAFLDNKRFYMGEACLMIVTLTRA
jgi:hypothetical protein